MQTVSITARNTTKSRADKRILIVRRAEIPAITTIEHGGRTVSLGIHQDFRRHDVLRKYMPENARLSMAWVHLEAGETLAVHDHPTVSIIVITKGEGRCLGDSDDAFSEGDVLVIAPGVRHGFIGSGSGGYWALSIQVEGEGLYENTVTPRVTFESGTRPPAFERLLAFNTKCTEEHVKSELFAFIDGADVRDRGKRQRLLDAIQVWSNFYQRMVLLRGALAEQPKHRSIAEEHLKEEFGHNRDLARDRAATLEPVWDPTLEAASSWFTWKMFTLDEAAKTALVHLVLEGGSTAFHARAHRVMSEFQETSHFGVHDEADEGHFTMGLAALEDLTDAQYAYLTTVVREGWDMLTLACNCMARVAIEKPRS